METETNMEVNKVEKKVVALSFVGENFSSKFLLCWTNTLSILWQSGEYEFLIATGDNPSLYHSRLRSLGLNNEIIRPFNNTKFDYWVTIDSSILFSPQQVIELIKSLDEHPIVSGLYKTNDGVSYNAVKQLDNDYFATNGHYQYLLQDDVDNWTKEVNAKYMPVEFVGLSFFGMRSDVFEKLEYPFFDGERVVIKKDDTTTYDIVPSEDYNLCKKLLSKDYKIMLNTELRVGNSINFVV